MRQLDYASVRKLRRGVPCGLPNSPPSEGCPLGRGGSSLNAAYKPPRRLRRHPSKGGEFLIVIALLLIGLLPSLANADAGYSTSSIPVITPSSSSQVIQPSAGSASPNSGLPSPLPSSDSSSDSKDTPKASGPGINPIQPRPDIQARPAFKDRL
jgi:hypothetical protein